MVDTQPLVINPGGPVVTVAEVSSNDAMNSSEIMIGGPSTNSHELVRTGSEVLRLVAMGVFLLLAGSLLLLTGRRRRLTRDGPAER